MNKTATVYILLLCNLVFFTLQSTVVAQVRTSTNYHIQSDSINVGGGWSSSTSYIQESTVGEIATGESGSASFNLYAGYQQMQASYLALSSAANVSLSSIPGMSGGESDGSTYVIATTDSSGGYQLSINASGDPAMQSASSSIADYVPAIATPDVSFTTDATDAHFAFSVSGADIANRYKTNGTVCGVGVSSTTACWDGLSTTKQTVSETSSPNHPSGATTTFHFRVGIGNSVNQAPGAYVATTTITLIAL